MTWMLESENIDFHFVFFCENFFLELSVLITLNLNQRYSEWKIAYDKIFANPDFSSPDPLTELCRGERMEAEFFKSGDK